MPHRVSIVVASMHGGGAEQATLKIASYLATISGYEIDLVLRNFSGSLLPELPNNINIFVTDKYYSRLIKCDHIGNHCAAKPVIETRKMEIGKFFRVVVRNWPFGIDVLPRRKNRYVTSANSLAKYFAIRNPDIVFTVLPNDFFCSFIARGINPKFIAPIVCSIRNATNHSQERPYKIFKRLLSKAEWVHTVSKGIKQDLIAGRLCSKDRVSCIYNILDLEKIDQLTKLPCSHKWFKSDKRERKYKLILAVGRLSKQKNFGLLIDSFVRVNDAVATKLLILGEGEERLNLEKRIYELGLSSVVSMPGWVKNPYCYMSQCDALVLSSDYEGLPNILLEALRCGCNIVSTDCPHGPKEILDGGKFGSLVPTNNEIALADAIINELKLSPDRSGLRDRAAKFSIDNIGPQYEKLFIEILNHSRIANQI